MRRWQHVQVKLAVTLTVQLPTTEELKGNMPAYQEPALTDFAVRLWENGARKFVEPNCTAVGVVAMSVERQ